MSLTLVGACWRCQLDKTSLLILMALCDAAEDDGSECYPKPDYLKYKTGSSLATIYRVLEKLEKIGVLETDGMRGTAQRYRIHLEQCPQKQPYKRPKMGRPMVWHSERDEKSSHGEKTKSDFHFSHGEKSPSHGEKSPSHGEKSPSHGEKRERSSEAPPEQENAGENGASIAGYPFPTIQSLSSPDPFTPQFFFEEHQATPKAGAADRLRLYVGRWGGMRGFNVWQDCFTWPSGHKHSAKWGAYQAWCAWFNATSATVPRMIEEHAPAM